MQNIACRVWNNKLASKVRDQSLRQDWKAVGWQEGQYRNPWNKTSKGWNTSQASKVRKQVTKQGWKTVGQHLR